MYTLSTVAAAEPETSKLVTQDAPTLGHGVFEFELDYRLLGATRRLDDDGESKSRGRRRDQTWLATLSYGLTERIDVGIETGWAELVDRDGPGPSRGDGFTDVSMVLQWEFLRDETRRLSVAYVGGLTSDTGDDTSSHELGPGQGYWSIDQALLVTKSWNRWTTNAELAFFLPVGDDRDGARGTLEANVALGYQLREWVQPELELLWNRERLRGDDDPKRLELVAGLVFSASSRSLILLGGRRTLAGRSTDVENELIMRIQVEF